MPLTKESQNKILFYLGILLISFIQIIILRRQLEILFLVYILFFVILIRLQRQTILIGGLQIQHIASSLGIGFRVIVTIVNASYFFGSKVKHSLGKYQQRTQGRRYRGGSTDRRREGKREGYIYKKVIKEKEKRAKS